MRAMLLGINPSEAGCNPRGGWQREHFKAHSAQTQQVLHLLGFSVHIPIFRNNRLLISWITAAGKTRYSEAGVFLKEAKYFVITFAYFGLKTK